MDQKLSDFQKQKSEKEAIFNQLLWGLKENLYPNPDPILYYLVFYAVPIPFLQEQVPGATIFEQYQEYLKQKQTHTEIASNEEKVNSISPLEMEKKLFLLRNNLQKKDF